VLPGEVDGTGAGSRGGERVQPGQGGGTGLPATMPTFASSRTASSAAPSVTVTNRSTPACTTGQATIETFPQFSPAMIERWGPGTSTGWPALAEARPQAASTGSTATIVAVGGACSTAAAASAPTPIGTTTTSMGGAPTSASCSSTSAKIVA
jgi:hypothetical protein